MLDRLSLRFRIFLFFCLLALGAVALAGGALWFSWSRADLPAAPFITAFILFAFLNTGLALGIWLLFDENLAKPIDRLSTKLRLKAHAEGEDIATEDARYLGDLAPAALALSEKFSASVMSDATDVARETERLRAQSDRLTALLSEVPVATILLNAQRDIVLYDKQASEILWRVAPPRLRAPFADYFDPEPLEAAINGLSDSCPEAEFDLQGSQGALALEARVKSLSNDGYMVFIDAEQTQTPQTSRPLVFDFDLIDSTPDVDLMDTPLDRLCFVPFDTETTGLSVKDDDIIQLAALRVLNGKIIEGEVLDSYVNPGRPIPPASTRIHHISDADVVEAPNIAEVGRAFHHFARGAVLVAHNAPFDIGLLRRCQNEMGVVWDHPIVETVLLSAVVFGTTEDHTLDALCARLSISIPPEDRHTALGDAKATGAALVRMVPLLQARGISSLRNLLGETRKHGRLLKDLNA